MRLPTRLGLRVQAQLRAEAERVLADVQRQVPTAERRGALTRSAVTVHPEQARARGEVFARGGMVHGLSDPSLGGGVVWRRRPWVEATLQVLDLRWQWEQIRCGVDVVFRVAIDRPMRWVLYRPEPAARAPSVSEEAATGPCAHPGAVPVRTVGLDADLVAWLCPACDEQLPADRRAWVDEHGRLLNPAPSTGNPHRPAAWRNV